MAVYTVLFICAIVACIGHIFFTGPLAGNVVDGFTYSPEKVNSYLVWLSIPFAIYVAAIIFGAVFYSLYPQKINENAKIRSIDILRRVKPYSDSEISNVENRKILNRNKTVRFIFIILSAVIGTFCLFTTCWFLSDPNLYILDSDVIKHNLDLFLSVLPFITIALVWGIATVFVFDITAKQDLNILRNEKLFKLNKQVHPLLNEKTKNISINVIRIAVGVTAITFIILGVCNGGMKDVFIKAINICTECIGLG
jgi:hypothetical protein